MPDPSSSAREALRAVCNAGGELGCSCADQNYQWFDHACRENMATAIKAMLKAQNEQPKFHYDNGEHHAQSSRD